MTGHTEKALPHYRRLLPPLSARKTMGRKLFAIVLLFGVLAMSASVYCQSLCISGHGMHPSSHAKKELHASTHNQHQAERCDLSHSNEKESGRTHSGRDSSIKCDCSGELTVVQGYHLLANPLPVHAPVLTEVATVRPFDPIYHSPDTLPSEGPPKIIA